VSDDPRACDLAIDHHYGPDDALSAVETGDDFWGVDAVLQADDRCAWAEQGRDRPGGDLDVVEFRPQENDIDFADLRRVVGGGRRIDVKVS